MDHLLLPRNGFLSPPRCATAARPSTLSVCMPHRPVGYPCVSARVSSSISISTSSQLQYRSTRQSYSSARSRASVSVSASATVGDAGGAFGGAGAAIELRSRLRQLDLEFQNGGGAGGGDGRWELIEGAWVRMPRGRAWGVVHFVGGAVLGSYPHIAYDAYLGAVSDDAQLIVIATPYDLSTDHAAIAADVAQKRDKALAAVVARDSYPPSMPVFGVGHSLGAKLHLLLASGAAPSPPLCGHVLVAVNNASATDTVRLLEDFARTLLERRKKEDGAGGGGGGAGWAAFEQVVSGLPSVSKVAAQAAKMTGLEFVPSPEETLEMVRAAVRTARVHVIKFTDDQLDMNEEVVAALQAGGGMRPAVSVTELPGNHLTPVVLRLQPGAVNPRLQQVQDLAIGDEAAVRELAEETVRQLRAV